MAAVRGTICIRAVSTSMNGQSPLASAFSYTPPWPPCAINRLAASVTTVPVGRRLGLFMIVSGFAPEIGTESTHDHGLGRSPSPQPHPQQTGPNAGTTAGDFHDRDGFCRGLVDERHHDHGFGRAGDA